MGRPQNFSLRCLEIYLLLVYTNSQNSTSGRLIKHQKEVILADDGLPTVRCEKWKWKWNNWDHNQKQPEQGRWLLGVQIRDSRQELALWEAEGNCRKIQRQEIYLQTIVKEQGNQIQTSLVKNPTARGQQKKTVKWPVFTFPLYHLMLSVVSLTFASENGRQWCLSYLGLCQLY